MKKANNIVMDGNKYSKRGFHSKIGAINSAIAARIKESIGPTPMVSKNSKFPLQPLMMFRGRGSLSLQKKNKH
tara:strand:+ start:1144 stop:1362 length:219 start_codon:yes stop_codon:yes gene_type:complete